MLDTSLVKNCEPTRVTGWLFDSSNGNPQVCIANETHSKMTTGNHEVFNAGKPLPKLENVEELKTALVEAGVLLISRSSIHPESSERILKVLPSLYSDPLLQPLELCRGGQE